MSSPMEARRRRTPWLRRSIVGAALALAAGGWSPRSPRRTSRRRSRTSGLPARPRRSTGRSSASSPSTPASSRCSPWTGRAAPTTPTCPRGRQVLARRNPEGVEYRTIAWIPPGVRPCPALSGAGLSARRRQPPAPRRGRVVAQPGALRPRRRDRPVPRVVARDHVVAGEPDREPRRRRQRPQADLQRRRRTRSTCWGCPTGDRGVLPRVQSPHAVGRVRVGQRAPGGARQPLDRRRRPDARHQPAEQAVLRRQRRPGPAVPDLVGGPFLCSSS